MIKITLTELVQKHCKLTQQWAVVIYPSSDDHSFSDMQGAVPFLDLNNDLQAMADGLMIVLCDSEMEHDRVFNSIVGDDGPTKLNKYNGPYKAYAWTCGPDGEILTENT